MENEYQWVVDAMEEANEEPTTFDDMEDDYVLQD